MNIAIVSSNDIRGGAARASYRLHKGFRLANHISEMVVRTKSSQEPDVHGVRISSLSLKNQQEMFWIWVAQKHAIDRNRTERSNTFFTLPYPGYDISKTDVVLNAQVINLHWIARFQSVESIAKLLSLGKPVVWTLHDENPFTGGCHYTAGCKKYQTNCMNCPQLEDIGYQIPFKVLQKKRDSWKKNLTVVAPSQWLASCAKNSAIFGNCRVETIPNSLETDIFRPEEKRKAKEFLEISPEAVVILFVAEYHGEKRKGFRKFLEAIEYCLKNNDFKNMVAEKKICLLAIGDPQQELAKLQIPVFSFGYLNSDERLATIYSAADIFVLPSLEDNLPNTLLEAMACGTPVVSFKVGGMPDMIQNGITGYTVPPFRSDKLGESILNLVFNQAQRQQMGENCRRLIEKKFKLRYQTEAYLNLFRELGVRNHIGNTQRKFRESVNRNKKIILPEWDSQIRGDFFTSNNNSLHIDKLKEAEIHSTGSQSLPKGSSSESGGAKPIAISKALLLFYLVHYLIGRKVLALFKYTRNHIRKFLKVFNNQKTVK